MGLEFTHCNASWSYSGFATFRRRLAKSIGMDLDKMENFGGNIPFSTFSDAIIPLLNHADSSSSMSARLCKTVAPRLREVISSWPDLDEDGYPDWDKENGLELAAGMEEAASRNEMLIFR